MGPEHLIHPSDILVFTLDKTRYALPLSCVKRAVRAVEITPLPKAPRIVLGVINLQGAVIAVVDMRSRLRLPARELSLDDRFLIALTPSRQLALVVDSLEGIRQLDREQIAGADGTLGLAPHLKGVAKLADGMALVYDLDRFLSLEEEGELDEAMARGN